MHLLDLSYDVLLRIFQFLDVASLLRITRVSSAFRRLALSKHVWLAVVSDLRRRHLLNIPPDDSLVHFSTAQLVAEVRRAATGPFTWAADSLGEPIVRRTTHVPMLGPMESTPCEPTLLPGDKQLLVKRGTGCEIWDIAGGRQLWACNSVCREHIAVQPLHSGTQLLLVTWTGEPFRFVDDPAELNCKIVIRLHLLDLTTNTETRIMSVHLPPAFADLSEPLIAGDFWAATAQWFAGGIGWEQGILMVNWKERRCLLLKCDVVHKHILDGHLLALTHAGLRSDVVLFPASSLEEAHWQPFTSEALTAAAHTPVRIEPLVLQRVEYPPLLALYIPTPFMSVHCCVLRSGSYIVSTHAASLRSRDPDDETQRRPSFHRYRLTLPTSRSAPPTRGRISSAGTFVAPPTWERISSAGTFVDVFIDSFTYAGYGLSFSSERHRPEPRVVLQCRPATATNVDGRRAPPLAPNASGRVSLSPDTGALTVCSARGADVYYYE